MYEIKKRFDGATGTYSLVVNGETVMECLSKKKADELTDSEAIYWYEQSKN